MTRSDVCPVCGEATRPHSATCATCGWILISPEGGSGAEKEPRDAESPAGGGAVPGDEPVSDGWRRLRIRTEEVRRLESLLWERAKLLDERAAEIERRTRRTHYPRRGKGAAEELGTQTPLPEIAGRVAMRVRGLDEALGGGIPRGFVVVLAGAPGTMKTTLALWVLAKNAATSGRAGLYVTCEESAGSLLRQAAAIGIPIDALRGKVHILDGRTVARAAGKRTWLTGLKEAVEAARKADRLDLLVLDSLESLETLARFGDRRQEIFRLFEWLRGLDLTALVIAERADYVVRGMVLQPRHEEDFLADGVLHLRMHATSDVEVQRRIRVVKMRGTRHEMGYLALHVGHGDLEASRVLGG